MVRNERRSKGMNAIKGDEKPNVYLEARDVCLECFVDSPVEIWTRKG
jgi:hypothetical protein